MDERVFAESRSPAASGVTSSRAHDGWQRTGTAGSYDDHDLVTRLRQRNVLDPVRLPALGVEALPQDRADRLALPRVIQQRRQRRPRDGRPHAAANRHARSRRFPPSFADDAVRPLHQLNTSVTPRAREQAPQENTGMCLTTIFSIISLSGGQPMGLTAST